MKKLESQIRFKDLEPGKKLKYVWDQYFSTKDENDSSVKYNMASLHCMTHDKLKEVFEEYFYHVYYQYYKEEGIPAEGVYDIVLLSALGLPMNASIEAIKSKFRELAKKYHPDHGGDSSKFRELVDIYKRLTE
jgi:hypothetical protein